MVCNKATEAEEEVEETLDPEFVVISVEDWDTQLRDVPCESKFNPSKTTVEVQEVSLGGHPDKAGVVLAVEEEDRHGSPQ